VQELPGSSAEASTVVKSQVIGGRQISLNQTQAHKSMSQRVTTADNSISTANSVFSSQRTSFILSNFAQSQQATGPVVQRTTKVQRVIKKEKPVSDPNLISHQVVS